MAGIALMALATGAAAQDLAPVREDALPANLPHVVAKGPARFLTGPAWAPRMIWPAPPATGSVEEQRELAEMHRLIAAAAPARLAQAALDGKAENPTAFSAALGHDLRDLPRTWALLITIEQEADALVNMGKDTFGRPRPYITDRTMPTCVKVDPHKASRAYPSGHAGFGYSTAWALARLAPGRAPQILARAEDYALSRWLCGVHFPSDTAASHPVAVLVADRLLAEPALAGDVRAAREELSAAGIR
jgi:acid phosphatase (class A)